MFRFLLVIGCLALVSCAGGSDETVGGAEGGNGKADGPVQDAAASLADGYHFTISSSLEISEEGDEE